MKWRGGFETIYINRHFVPKKQYVPGILDWAINIVLVVVVIIGIACWFVI